jgi:type II secretory pathway pseudopilin PulG
LIVITLVAVLAAIAIPRFATSSRRSKEAALRNTLRNVRVAQERFFQLYEAYPNDLEDLTDPNRPTTGVWTDNIAVKPWGTRVYQGPLIEVGQIASNVYIKDPVSGSNLSVSRQSNGELRIRSSASGNDSTGKPYSSY